MGCSNSGVNSCASDSAETPKTEYRKFQDYCEEVYARERRSPEKYLVTQDVYNALYAEILGYSTLVPRANFKLCNSVTGEIIEVQVEERRSQVEDRRELSLNYTFHGTKTKSFNDRRKA